MLTKTAIALAATASVVLGAAALTPAAANYAPCYENPAAPGCPGNYDIAKKPLAKRAAHEQSSSTRHHG
jgi:hypothetical protein